MSVSHKKGFTLIELLVVIAIISLLSSIVSGGLMTTRQRSRDVVRVSDMKELTTSLELYYDTYGRYPCGDKEDDDPTNVGGTMDGSSNESFLNDIHGRFGFTWPGCGLPDDPYDGIYPTFYSKYGPEDPSAVGSHRYWYYVTPDRQSYVITAVLENNDDLMINDGGINDGYCNNTYDLWGGAVRIGHC